MEVYHVDEDEAPAETENDWLMVVSGSGSGKPLEDARYAKKKGMNVMFITQNKGLIDEFDYVIVIPKNNHYREEFAPMGTEFEQAAAVVGCSMVHVLGKASYSSYESSCQDFINSMSQNLNTLLKQEEYIDKFLGLIDDCLRVDLGIKTYWVGAESTQDVMDVGKIRFNHLNKRDNGNYLKNFRSRGINNWGMRQSKDVGLFASGSGMTKQTLTYLYQAIDAGMRVFGFTSFKESSLGMRTKPYGNLIIKGRDKMESLHDKPMPERGGYKAPFFEMNLYLTLDALLALIAKRNGITPADMKGKHKKGLGT
jgi:D-arabinose 5-phosphate isomerase GutQ